MNTKHTPRHDKKDKLIAQLGEALSLATRTLDGIYCGANAGKEWHRSPRRKEIAQALKEAGLLDPADIY